MIKVAFEFANNLFSAITIEGHSNYAEKGSDIVCAGVSAIGVGGLNALLTMTNPKPRYEMNDGYLYIEFLSSQSAQIIAQVMEIQLKSIEENYKKYIKITYRR